MPTISISAKFLELAGARNSFAIPDGELIFFGIRGALPDSSSGSAFAADQSVRTVDVDYKHMRCTLGQWNRAAGTIALFPGSTVPSLPNIAKAKEAGGAGANMLLPGYYEYERGIHKPGSQSGHRAFRQAKFFPVRRTRDNTSYDAFDDIDFGDSAGQFFWDNLHAAYSDNTESGYSSAGCQVVCGLPSSPRRGNAPETGPWRDFIQTGYSQFSDQKSFSYLLFAADDLALIAATDPKDLDQIVRFGSSGDTVRKVQKALIGRGNLTGKADGIFGRNSLAALVAFQSQVFPRSAVDGVCGSQTASALGITLPKVLSATPIAALQTRVETSEVATPDMEDETDMTAAEVSRLLATLGIGKLPVAPAEGPMAVTQPFAPFFDVDRFCRSVSDGPFSGQPDASQRLGMSQVIDTWFRLYPGGDPRWLAYILATIFHETGRRMVPVREGFATTDAGAQATVRRLLAQHKISVDYSLPDPRTGLSYFGRGRVQVTHFDNYRRMTDRFHRDFVRHPELLLDPLIDAEVAVVGHVEGLWTGRKLGDFIDGERCDYRLARQIVNRLDKADDIASFAHQFERAIRIATAADELSGGLASRPINRRPEGAEVVSDENLVNKVRELESLLLGLVSKSPDQTIPLPDLQLEKITAAVDSLTGSNLTPVNAALGPMIGNLLNGKKTIIGIVGSVLAAMVASSSQSSSIGTIAGAVNSILPTAGLAGPLLPVMVAIAAWGMLGKIEKMILKANPKP